MEETIHIYIESILKSEKGAVSATKKRLWPSLIVSIRWLFKNPISERTIIQNGLGLTVINSLAIAVEGFLCDLLVDYHDNYKAEKPEIINRIENSNWNSKVKLYNRTFENKITQCTCYDSVKILLLLRNNTAHGRTHREKGVMPTDNPDTYKMNSLDYNYQEARQYFQKMRLIAENDKFSNVESLWQIRNVLFLFTQIEIFLNSLLENSKSEKFDSIKSELNNAFKMTI